MTRRDFRYDAFLSYATEADYELARELEDFLERFHELPTPAELPLRPLSIWRDGGDVSIADERSRGGITSILEHALAESRYLVLLWSGHSRGSTYVRFELEWFLEHRGVGSIRLGITDARDPRPDSSELFLHAMVASGLTRRPWYDFRGFHRDRLPEARRLRDFDEARVQLAADLNGRSPADIQPLWWRNKVREEQARAEREERARRRIELAECDARLEAANGWYERAFTAIGARNYSAACTCLVEALAIADPARVPEHYDRTRERPGWAESAWAFLRYVLALAPRLRALEWPALPEADDEPRGGIPFLAADRPAEFLSARRLAWGDRGRQVVVMGRSALRVYDLPRGTLKATLEPPAGAGALTTWAAARATDRIVAGTMSGQVVAWTGGGPPSVVGAHHATVTAVGIAPDGSAATTASSDGEIRLWAGVASLDGGGGEIVRESDGESVTLVVPVQDNSEILFLTGSKLRVKNLESGEERELHGLVTRPAVAVDDDGEIVAYGDWDIVRRSSLREPGDAVLYVGEHRGFVDEIAFSTRAEHLFTRAIGRELCVWEGRERPLQRGMTFLGMQMTQSFGTANRGSLLKRLDELGDVDAIATHPGDPDRFLIMRHECVAEGHLGFAWRPAASWRPSARGLRSATWLPDGRRIVCGADDGSLSLLSLDGDRAVVPLAAFDAPVGDIAVSPDGGLVAAVTEDGQVAVLTAPDGRRLAVEQLPSVPFAIAFAAADGATVAVGCHDGVIRLWDWRQGNAIRRLGACDSGVHALAVDHAARTLVAGCENGELSGWDLAEESQLWSSEDTRETQARFGGSVQDVAVSPDGELVVAGMLLSAVCVLDLATGRERAWVPVRSSVPGKPEQVTAVGVCDDGRTALVGLWDGTLCVVDTVSARELLRFPAHTKVVTAVAQAHGTGDVMTASLDEDPENDGVRVWTMLDVDTVPSRQPVRPDWPDTVRTAVERRNGVERTSQPAEEARGDRDQARIPALRAELAREPGSPELNLALAMALIDAGRTNAAQDYVARAHRLGGGEQLITDVRAQGLVAASLLADGRVEDALPWLRRAAAGDDPESLMQLGLLCLTHRIQGNEAEGVDYLRRSADRGHAMAAYNLGVYYEQVAAGAVAETDWRQIVFGEGGGTNVHETEAIHWYQVAANGGNERADEALARLTGRVASDD